MCGRLIGKDYFLKSDRLEQKTWLYSLIVASVEICFRILCDQKQKVDQKRKTDKGEKGSSDPESQIHVMWEGWPVVWSRYTFADNY